MWSLTHDKRGGDGKSLENQGKLGGREKNDSRLTPGRIRDNLRRIRSIGRDTYAPFSGVRDAADW